MANVLEDCRCREYSNGRMAQFQGRVNITQHLDSGAHLMDSWTWLSQNKVSTVSLCVRLSSSETIGPESRGVAVHQQ